MTNKDKMYKSPRAEITEFECEDIITSSGRQLLKRPENSVGSSDYILVQSKSWSELFKEQQ